MGPKKKVRAGREARGSWKTQSSDRSICILVGEKSARYFDNLSATLVHTISLCLFARTAIKK